jgi:hypothetical protein
MAAGTLLAPGHASIIATTGPDADSERGPSHRGDAILVIGTCLWIAIGTWLDADGSLGRQRTIGAATWFVLAAAIRRERPAQRFQILTALIIATVGEFVCSLALGLYDYRLANVPSYVPPGHGLVYLAAINLARGAFHGRLGDAMRWVTLAAGGAWAIWGVTFAPRHDSFGLVLYLAFAGFVLFGASPHMYVAAYLLTTYLEFVGTGFGNWRWAPETAGALFTMGNPPTGIPGAYCVLDLGSLRGGWALFRRWRAWRLGRFRRRYGRAAGGGPPDGGAAAGAGTGVVAATA